MAEGKLTDTGVNKADASSKLRADELELWDRVLNRWDKHTGRQVKIAVSAVSFVIVVVGFLGVRSLDSMVEERCGRVSGWRRIRLWRTLRKTPNACRTSWAQGWRR